MTSDVFRPSNGPLIIRDNLAEGLGESAEVFRKNRPHSTGGYRPESRGGYRFGQLSFNSFFARHNPHPTRVRHMKGFLDVPICSVNDDGALSNPRYSHHPAQFPPSNHDDVKLQQYARFYNVPVNAINVNSQRHPINTITGLQYFQGKALNMRIFKEKAIPRVGMVQVTEGWRDELRALTEALGVAPPAANQPQPQQQHESKPGTGSSNSRPRTCQYSAETGRLIPPPSRAMSRGASRGNSRASARQEQFINRFDHIVEDPGLEGQVLLMLCQILQTDDISAVKLWLVNGSDREKEQVLNMIQAALESNDQYYKHNPNPNPDYKVTEDIGRTLGNAETDRLTLDGDEPRPATVNGEADPPAGREEPPAPGNTRPPTAANKVPSPVPIPEHEDATRPPVLPDIFKKPTTSTGVRTYSKQADRPSSRVVAKTPIIKYTRVPTPSGGGGIVLSSSGGGGGRVVSPSGGGGRLASSSGENNTQQLQSILKDSQHVWEPRASIAVN